jgi:hypothetical protein
MKLSLSSDDMNVYGIPCLVLYLVALSFLIASTYSDLECWGKDDAEKCSTLAGLYAQSDTNDTAHMLLTEDSHSYGMVARAYALTVGTAVVLTVAAGFEVVVLSYGLFLGNAEVQKIVNLTLVAHSVVLSLMVSDFLPFLPLLSPENTAPSSALMKPGIALDLALLSTLTIVPIVAMSIVRIASSRGPVTRQPYGHA